MSRCEEQLFKGLLSVAAYLSTRGTVNFAFSAWHRRQLRVSLGRTTVPGLRLSRSPLVRGGALFLAEMAVTEALLAYRYGFGSEQFMAASRRNATVALGATAAWWLGNSIVPGLGLVVSPLFVLYFFDDEKVKEHRKADPAGQIAKLYLIVRRNRAFLAR